MLLVAGVLAAGAAAATAPRVAHTSAGTKQAQGSLLRVGDFGSGWTATAAQANASGLNFACAGFSPKQNDVVEIGAANSQQFKGSAVGPFVVQRTSVYASPAVAERLWKRAMKPKLFDCASQSLETLEQQGLGVEVTGRQAIALGPVGDRAAGYRIVATLSGKQRLKTYYDLIYVKGGRSITQLTISQFQKPVPLKWQVAVAKIAARRLGASGPAA